MESLRFGIWPHCHAELVSASFSINSKFEKDADIRQHEVKGSFTGQDSLKGRLFMQHIDTQGTIENT